MGRDNTVQFRTNDREEEYLDDLADKFDVSRSEAIRIVLFDSRFLYSENVDFGDINVPAEDLLDEDDTDTTAEEALERIVG